MMTALCVFVLPRWLVRRAPRHSQCVDSDEPLLPCLGLRSQVAKKPTGEDINALEQHVRNLLTPSTPYFFNTLYDPYVPGSDFVRGYPFSLRQGVPTAVSHGKFF